LTDLSQTIAPKSDQINADDLIAGPRTIRIARVSADPSSPEQPVAIYFEGDNGKPYKPCKSMRRVMVAAWGPDGSKYPGRLLTLYRDPAVQFGGMQVGGIRISHMSHIEKDMTMALTVTKARRAGYTVKRIEAPAPAPAKAQENALDAAAVEAATKAANEGEIALRGWWETAGRDDRAAVKPTLDRLKAIAAKADAAREADPFGLPPIDARPQASISDAEAEAVARAEFERQRAAELAQIEGRA
jgi:hypothetical protein